MANKPNGTLYTGITSDIIKRAYQHRNNIIEGFTKRYCCHRLVWYLFYDTMEQAIMREKNIKAGSRTKKIALIEQENYNWYDLYPTLL